MKRSIIIATFGVLLCVNMFSQILKIGDFEMPVTKAEKFYIGGNFNFNSNDTISIYKGALDLNYSKFYSSLPYSYFLNANILADLNDNDFGPDVKDPKRLSTIINFNYQRYFSDESKFYYNVITNSDFTFYTSNIWKESQNFYGNYDLGIGYGRLIDATSIAKALRIQEFLISNNQLSGEMEKEIVMEVAQHCDKLKQYEIDFGEKYQEEWFLDLEKIMMKSGKLTTGNLNPFSVLRVMEVLYAETIWYRPVGWSVSSNVSVNVNYYKTVNLNNDENDNFSLNYYVPSINFNFGYPISNSLHFYNTTNFIFFSEFEFSDYWQTQSQTSLSYNLTNLFNIRLYYYLNMEKYYSHSLDIRHYFKATTSYYLENNFSINISYFFSNTINERSPSVFYQNTNDSQLTIGFNYRFW